MRISWFAEVIFEAFSMRPLRSATENFVPTFAFSIKSELPDARTFTLPSAAGATSFSGFLPEIFTS